MKKRTAIALVLLSAIAFVGMFGFPEDNDPRWMEKFLAGKAVAAAAIFCICKIVSRSTSLAEILKNYPRWMMGSKA